MITNGAAGRTYLRNTLFFPGKPPVTTIIPKEDLKKDIHVTANEMRERFGNMVDVEIFMWEGDLVSASVEAGRRAEVGRTPERQKFKSTLHDFLIATFFMTTPTGVIAPPSPAPLRSDDVKEILEVVRHHAQYKAQTVLIVTEDAHFVRLAAGEITTGKIP